MPSRRFHASLLAGALAALIACAPARAQSIVPDLEQEIRQRAAAIEERLIAWRRDIHEHPELGEQETRTAGLVAAHLKKLGLEVKTGVARTGVVALLKGSRPGPVVALRADMDALPVKEPAGLPFASKAKGKYLGREVDVMHACGHDAHTAILMATAEILTAMKDKLPGTVKFMFQPAEEGPSLFAPFTGASWGAKQMIKEGVLQDPRPDAVFGLHMSSGMPAGRIGYRAGAAAASADELRIKVTGRQGHAGYPWRAVDPVTTAAQIVLGAQTIVSRRTDLMRAPTVLSISTINGGSRFNIVPETVEMTGTIRTYDAEVRKGVHRDLKQVAENIAASADAKAEVEIIELYDPLVNNARMTSRMAPVLERAADGNIQVVAQSGAAEDFSFFLNEVPGLFFNVGVVPPGQDPAKVAPNHSPNFMIDESSLVVGVRALASVTVNYLAGAKTD
jgi:amidohydrolase